MFQCLECVVELPEVFNVKYLKGSLKTLNDLAKKLEKSTPAIFIFVLEECLGENMARHIISQLSAMFNNIAVSNIAWNFAKPE